jgi:hypothetical protein
VYEAAFERADHLAPHDEQTFWYALRLAQTLGETERAVDLLDPIFARAPQWRELLMRLDWPDLAGLRAAVGERE